MKVIDREKGLYKWEGVVLNLKWPTEHIISFEKSNEPAERVVLNTNIPKKK